MAAYSEDVYDITGKFATYQNICLNCCQAIDQLRQTIIPVEATLAELEAKIISLNRRGGKAAVRALKEGKVAAEGEISFLMADRAKWPQS